MGIYGGSLLLWSINVNHVMMPTDSKIPNDAKFECLQTAPVRLPAVQPANAVLLVSVLRDMSSYLSPATEVAAVPSYLWSHLSNWNLFIKSAMDVLRCKMIIIYCNCMILIAMLSLIIPQHSHVQNSKHIQLQLGESTKTLTLQGAKRPARNQKQGSYRLL